MFQWSGRISFRFTWDCLLTNPRFEGRNIEYRTEGMDKVVWILNHYALEPGGAGGTRHYSLARHMLPLGWQPYIIAASTELNTGRQRLRHDETTRMETFDGVSFMWLRVPTYNGNGIGRVRNMVSYTVAALRGRTLRQLPPPDVIIGSSVHPLAAWAGARLARRYQVPFIFEVRDLWPETLIDMGRLKRNGLVARLLRRLEERLYKQATVIISVLPKAVDYITQFGVPAAKVRWIPNGAEVSSYAVTAEPPTNPFTFMYFGAHGQANGLDVVLKAYGQAIRLPGMPPSRLRLIGDGPAKAGLIKLAEELRISTVSFEKPVRKAEIPALAAQAHAFVFHLHDIPVFRFGISSNKLFDYLATGRPVLFGCNASNNPVQEARAGLTVPADSVDKMAQAMLAVATMSAQERASMGQRGYDLVHTQYAYLHLAKQLVQVLNEVQQASRE